MRGVNEPEPAVAANRSRKPATATRIVRRPASGGAGHVDVDICVIGSGAAAARALDLAGEGSVHQIDMAELGGRVHDNVERRD